MAQSQHAQLRVAGPEQDAPSGAAARIGQRYQVGERLGRGGSSVVYRVRDVTRNQEFALKQLTQHDSSRDREQRTQFEREYSVLSQLSHPNIIQVHDFGVDDAGPFYTMELLDAGDLSTRAPWPYLQACQLMMQVSSALSLLHSRGLVHRDISPRNVRCTRQGSAKLIDFGAMVAFGAGAQVVGTPGFVAPEVVHRLALDARTDLFSLGATLYYALTGRPAFTARSLAELAQAWGDEPVPPSELVAGIPALLDALVLSMLRMDPARRPSSAFEVMQRLAAITGTALPESVEIARACLTTPLLVGREAAQRWFRQRVQRAIQGEGCGLWVQGDSGLGRTRLLDTFVIAAKLSGATVLNVACRAAGSGAFASARQWALQLVETLPEQALACAAADELTSTLFGAPDTLSPEASLSTRLRALSSSPDEAGRTQAALHAWLSRVCQRHPLVIAVDDVEHIDDSSLALLVALVHGASAARLLVVSTALREVDTRARPALGVLMAHSMALSLAPLAVDETAALFSSVFCAAPYASLVSDRIHQIASGNPRESLALAHYMLEHQLIRFADGNWYLPAQLSVSDLPASARDALRAQLASLPQLPRLLAECHALALEGSWSQSSYYLLAADAGAEQVDQALALLVRQGVFSESAGNYTLSHLTVQACLIAQLTAVTRRRHELALAELSARQGRHGLYDVYHLLQADESERALDRLVPLVEATTTIALLHQQSGLGRKTLAQLLDQAHAQSLALRRAPRETFQLTRLLVAIGYTTDSRLYYRHAPAWLAQIERDSGLCDYRQAAQVAPEERLSRALEVAAGRYARASERERVYRVDEAIRQLVAYVNISLGMIYKAQDLKLSASLPELLAPFAVLSPALDTSWHSATAVHEYAVGQSEQARTRTLQIYARLAQFSGHEVPYLDELRRGLVGFLALTEVGLGYQSAEQWIALLDDGPLLRVRAQHLRRVLCILDGDLAGAQHHASQAELLAAQSGAMSTFDTPLALELDVQMHAGDLTGVKQSADRIAQLAGEWPGWRALHEYAQGRFQWLRGDLPQAKAAFERALALSSNSQAPDAPLEPLTWVLAASAYIYVLSELGDPAQARAFGLQVLERVDALGITSGGSDHVRALALAEAKLGEHATAAARLDRLIAERSHLRPSMVARDLEARARVAIWAKDSAAASHFIQLATQNAAVGGSSTSLSKRGRLLDEARSAGVSVDVPLSEFESAVLQSNRPAALAPAHLLETVARLATPDARAKQVLSLLTQASGAAAGHLYYVQQAQLVCVATLGLTPDPALDDFAQGFAQHWLAQVAMTTIFTDADDGTGPVLRSWTDRAGKTHAIALLLPTRAATCVGLVALSGGNQISASREFGALSTALADHLLLLGDLTCLVPG